LLPPGTEKEAFVEVRQRVSYAELLQLYANAAVVVVPLNDSLLYPSGIRAVLESALLERAVVATFTPVLEEYMAGDKEIIYVRPRDAAQLRSAIASLFDDSKKRESLQLNAKRRVVGDYGMAILAEQLSIAVDIPRKAPAPAAR
jgi:glycosyltransferase involved in cell wall biosynthesis